MNLKDLLCNLSLHQNPPSIEIKSITQSSSQAENGSLFVCINGFHVDGHEFAADAYRRGCRTFLAERSLDLPQDAVVITVKDTHKALGLVACAFYGNPSYSMPLIGITGTKGKTTVACLLREILEKSGIPCGYIGTNGIQYRSVLKETKNTTPDAITLQKTLSEMRDAGCGAVVIEVSSQALKLERVAGTLFSCGIFTNLSPDHIGAGEHPHFEDYLACKRRLFTDFGIQTAICSADDPYTEAMLQGIHAKTVFTSLQEDADYAAKKVALIRMKDGLGVSFSVVHQHEHCDFTLSMMGDFNASNALLSATAAKECFGISLQKSANILENARISGRSETFALPNSALAVIDYAHNGESLRKLLTALRAYSPRRLICLFGSVGERTKGRRLELGQAASELADLCILTSDNPGNEPPEQILAEIACAFEKSATPYHCIPDRKEAILYGVREAKAGDILVLAGKGHETYQRIGRESIPFSEREILLSAIHPIGKT